MSRILNITTILLFAFVFSCRESIQRNAEKPNIILVMADDLGYGDVAFMGNPKVKTPNLDAMAAEVFSLTAFIRRRRFVRLRVEAASPGDIPRATE